MKASQAAGGKLRYIADHHLKHLADGNEALAGDFVVVGLAQVAEDISALLCFAEMFEELGEGIGFGDLAPTRLVAHALRFFTGAERPILARREETLVRMALGWALTV